MGGLRYSVNTEKGIRRRSGRKGFEYTTDDGKRVRDAETLARIKSLVIPPAWENVWICRDERGHLQATGRDARGRLQYRYHPRWREIRDAHKFDHMIDFARALPTIRRRVKADLALHGLQRRRVLATIVQLLGQQPMDEAVAPLSEVGAERHDAAVDARLDLSLEEG